MTDFSDNIGFRAQDWWNKGIRLRSAFVHGGLNRLVEILSERRAQGYSGRYLSYSWPKKLYLSKVTKTLEARRHYFIPHLRGAQAYGGIATLVHLAIEEARQGQNIHFVLMDGGGSLESIKKIGNLDDNEWAQIASRFSADRFDNKSEIHLRVSADDTFVASAWWTKLTLETADIPADKITYIIQDYEVLFYDETDPVESELRDLAAKSYQKLCHVRINSSFLADFLFQNEILSLSGGLSVEIFEPWVSPEIFFEDPHVKKQKQIFVYARPEVGRNRFDICLEALKIAAPQIPLDWNIYGLGTLQNDVDLGNGRSLKAKGKLRFDEYVHFLKSTPLGLCLMESPHPSYPPLELAACGGLVVCNRYANKDYSTLGKQFLCTDLNAELLAEKIIGGVSLIDPVLSS